MPARGSGAASKTLDERCDHLVCQLLSGRGPAIELRLVPDQRPLQTSEDRLGGDRDIELAERPVRLRPLQLLLEVAFEAVATRDEFVQDIPLRRRQRAELVQLHSLDDHAFERVMFKHRESVSLEHRLQHGHAVAFSSPGGLDGGKQAHHPLAVYVEEEIRLRGVVMVDASFCRAEPARNVVDARGLEALLHEAFGGLLEQLLLRSCVGCHESSCNWLGADESSPRHGNRLADRRVSTRYAVVPCKGSTKDRLSRGSANQGAVSRGNVCVLTSDAISPAVQEHT